jgi:hypothetical protein
MTPAEAKRRAIRTRYRTNVKSGRWTYNMRYDAYYVTKTRKWVEGKCKDPECMYCSKRPDLAPRANRSSNTRHPN